MRIGLFADPHANREALAACLEHASAQSIDRHAFLGDLVGYGADPGWVVDTVSALVEAGAAVALLGNHDEAVLHGAPRTMHEDARMVVDWTRARLTEAQTAFLRSLPFSVAEPGYLLVHANAANPASWEYVRSAEAAARSLAATDRRLVFCGHLHSQSLYHQGPSGRVEAFAPVPGVEIPLGGLRRWLAVLGAVGQPRDGNPAAFYAVFDTTRSSLTCHRVAYDAATASRKIRDAGLPAWLGLRLEAGG